MPIENRNLEAGTKLVARYKGKEITCVVEATTDARYPAGICYVVDGDSTAYKSPSAAGSSVLGGTACNGWRFWSVEGTEKPQRAPAKSAKAGRGVNPDGSRTHQRNAPKAPKATTKAKAAAAPKKAAAAKATRSLGSDKAARRSRKAELESALPFECGDCGERFATTELAVAHATEVHAA